MNCPNCKTTEALRLTVVADDNGSLFTFCHLCPRPKQEKLDFPAIVTKGKRGRGRPKKTQDHLDAYGLSPEEIARTQAQRPTVRMVDSDATRKRDDIIPFQTGKRAHVYVTSTTSGSVRQQQLIHKKITEKLGTDNYKIVGKNDYRITAEAV